MTDGKHVLEQIYEYETLCVEILAEGINICDIFQATCLPHKLPPSWSNYVRTMKHKERDFKLEELTAHIKIEEQNQTQFWERI